MESSIRQRPEHAVGGVGPPPRGGESPRASSLGRRNGIVKRRGATPRSCPAAAAHADQRPALSGGPAPLWMKGGRSTSNRGAPAASIRFPPSNFKHCLTLFSKSFSSFPRGTCSLSVSRQYLALDGIYHPLRAAFPNSPTRRPHLVEQHGPRPAGFSPSSTSRSRELGPGALQRMRLQTTTPGARHLDSQAGLFPVRSPLLGKSWLVSSPSLIDMLKFSEWSSLIRGPVRDRSTARRGPHKGGLAEPPPAFIHPSIVGGRPSVQVGSSRPLEVQGMWPGSPEHGLLRHGGGRMPPSIHFSQPSRQIPARPLGWPVPRGPGFIHPSIHPSG